MSNIYVSVGELASQGDEEALREIRNSLWSEEKAVEADAMEILSAIRGSGSVTNELRRRLFALSQKCLQLGDRGLATVLHKLAIGEIGQTSAQKKFHFEVTSDRRRAYKLLQLDRQLRMLRFAHECNSGYLPDEFQLETSVSYVLSVETSPDEPIVSIPICISSDTVFPTSMNIDLTAWRGLGDKFVWVPEVSCTIGGDLAARDSLPSMTVHVETIAVSRTPVQMKEYLVSLEKHGVISTKYEYLPVYMGKPLVKYCRGKWEATDIPVKDKHCWLDVPVVGVDFNCAKWYGSIYDLPNHLVSDLLTEYEWEALARGQDGRLFPWGDIGVPGFANIRMIEQRSEGGLESVGCRETDVSAFSLFDCSGNAEEWCKFGNEDSQNSKQEFAVARGGNPWYNLEQPSRLASRVVRHADYRHKKLTFRLAVRLKGS